MFAYLFGNGIFRVAGEIWAIQRKVASPLFKKDRCVEARRRQPLFLILFSLDCMRAIFRAQANETFKEFDAAIER